MISVLITHHIIMICHMISVLHFTMIHYLKSYKFIWYHVMKSWLKSIGSYPAGPIRIENSKSGPPESWRLWGFCPIACQCRMLSSAARHGPPSSKIPLLMRVAPRDFDTKNRVEIDLLIHWKLTRRLAHTVLHLCKGRPQRLLFWFVVLRSRSCRAIRAYPLWSIPVPFSKFTLQEVHIVLILDLVEPVEHLAATSSLNPATRGSAMTRW